MKKNKDEIKLIAKIIKDIRIDTDKGQKEIAYILNTTQQQYSLYETGVRELSVTQLKKICEYYKVSADYILGLPMDYARTRGETLLR